MVKKRNIVILGSTGSIGESTLQIVRKFPERFRIVGLSVNTNIGRLRAQVKEFKPSWVSIGDGDRAEEFRRSVRSVKVFSGRSGLEEIAGSRGVDDVVLAMVGAEAIFPLLKAITAGKKIVLANKESIVIGGDLVMAQARRFGSSIIPVDSEQSAIFQCLEGYCASMVSKIYLTASGGPLVDYSAKSLKGVSLKEVLRHPRWKMGRKITVDSATLMNKGLEVIEAKHLFGLDVEQIEVLVHRKALVHSIVDFVDGSMLAQMAITDMRVPIQYALSYPERWSNPAHRLDLLQAGPLVFENPDKKRFPCLGLAYEALRLGGSAPCVLNAANEVAVEAFLEGRLLFWRIFSVVEKTLEKTRLPRRSAGLEEILRVDPQARRIAREWVARYG